jgi:hypothetical protein
MLRISYDGGDRTVSGGLSGLRGQDGEGSATAEQGTLQPALPRAEFFRKGGAARDLVRGKRWLPLTSWLNLDRSKRRQRTPLFARNRRILKAYLLNESLSQSWN